MDTLSFALWNTRLAPPSLKRPSSDEHTELVESTIEDLIVGASVQLLALTEVRRIEVLTLLPRTARASWQVISDNSGDTHDFDTALAFDRSLIALEWSEFVTLYHSGARIRSGVLACLRLRDDTFVIVVVAHWRSDLGGHSMGNEKRQAAAWNLKSAVGRALEKLGTNAHILILGDFNAEPFDDVFHALPTSRSRGAALRHRPKAPDDLVFYNPSWRWLGERHPWNGTTTSSIAGTYSSEKLNTHSWRTVDQILVSPSLLTTSGWIFREDLSGIYPSPLVFDEPRGRIADPFDHLPIVGQLHRT